jgi:cysteine desulfurase NifS
MSAHEVRPALCGVCPSACWVRAHLEDGRLVRVEPDPDAPAGMFCTLGERSPEIVYSEHRLRHPLRRVGPKGTYEFERTSWDEAMGAIVAHLEETRRRHGPEAACIYTGRGSFELSLCDIFQPADAPISSASSVLFPYGSPNTTGVGALCYVSFAIIAPHVTLGEILVDMYSDYENAELIVVWGGNPATDSPPVDFHQILAARERGAEVVVIDPRRSETARATGAEWVPIRPGTDGALALALINVLLAEDLHDEDFARRWTVGFDELARYVQHFRPEVAEEITGVPAATVRSLARRMARARGVAPAMYSGLEYSDSGVQAIRATLVLWALAGQLDVPGGRNIRMKGNSFPLNRSGLVHNPDVGRAIGRDRFPLYSGYRGESHAIALPDAVLDGQPYPVRDLIVLGGSIITSWPNPRRWEETFAHLDMLVTIDRQLTADAAWADWVLPATTMYEVDSYQTYGPIFRLRERVIEPLGEARNDYRILTELAERLGYDDRYPRTEEDLLRHVLEGSGWSLEQVRAAGGQVQLEAQMMEFRKWEKGLLRPDGQPGFDTPSGKFEIASSILAEHGYDALPVYTEPSEGPLSRPDLAADFPLVFNSGSRVFTDFRSQHHGVPSLARAAPEPTVTLNTTDAAARGIASGDRVEVSTPRGGVTFTAVVTDDILPGAIDAAMGGGGPVGPPAWQDANVNELTDDTRYDPISGFPIYKALLCEVRKTGSGRGQAAAGGADEHHRRLIEQAKTAAPRPRRRVYLDHNATTPVDPEVRAAMEPFLGELCGNPSSLHLFADEVREAVDEARRQIARLLGTTPRRLVVTGGGSEANNLALKGVAWATRERGRHIVTSAVEHPAVLGPCRFLERQGWELDVLPVDRQGRVEPGRLRATLRDDTVLVSIMTANNEVGTIQPIAELAALAHERGALFHTDAVQAAGKIPLDVDEFGVDLATISAHKMHGPKGIGALFVRRGVTLEPLVHGGGQEHGLRSGTENVAGLVGFGRAAQLARARLGEADRLRALRDRLEQAVASEVPGTRLNGDPEARLPNTLSLALPGLRGESLVLYLSRRGIALSSGSACSAGSPEPSHALLAMGLSTEDAHCTVRFSLGHASTSEDIDAAVAALHEVLTDSARSVRFVPCR